MAEASAVDSSSRARTRALIVPREHGAWGLLFIPLFTGIAAGIAPAYRIGPLVLFAVAALALFWLRTPVESVLGSGVIAAHTAEERKTALLASLALATISAACLVALIWGGQNLKLFLIGFIAALALGIQMLLRRLGRWARMASQLVGAIALTATAPAAYYLGCGRFDSRAVILWAANWAFAGDQIHFVQLRIHSARAGNFSEKFAKGREFFFGQIVLLLALICAAIWRLTPPLVIVAFLPALFRGTRWFFLGPEPLNVKQLGWSEMKQGVIFGVLLAIAFLAQQR